MIPSGISNVRGIFFSEGYKNIPWVQPIFTNYFYTIADKN